MNTVIDRFFGDEVSSRERLFYLAMFLSGTFSLLFVFVAILMQTDIMTVSLYASVSVLGAVLFFLEYKTRKTLFLTVVYLIYVNLFAFPFLVLISTDSIIEAPVYAICSLVLTLVLLNGKARIIMYVMTVLIDLCTYFYRFVMVGDKGFCLDSDRTVSFFRIQFAFLTSAILCVGLIVYRNYLIKKEICVIELASKKAETVSDAKDIFLVNVSHEIRTPLNAIIGTTDLLLDSDATNSLKEKAFNISNAGHALLSITTDLLDFSNMNLDNVAPVNAKYDFAFMLNDIINLTSVRLLDSNINFYVDVDPDTKKYLIGDSAKIRQVIINLLSNAIKYTDNGFMSLSVSAEKISENEEKLLIKVSDSGIGIKKENLESIFDFYDLSADSPCRSALGLSFCKKLAVAMGGDIWAESEYTKGSTFYFEVTQLFDADDEGKCFGSTDNKDISVCFYITDSHESNNLKKVLDGIKVNNTEIDSQEEFVKECAAGLYDYYFIMAENFDNLKDPLAKSDIDWRKLVVISDCNYSYSEEPFEYVLTKPVSCLNVTDLLNQSKSYAIRKQFFEGSFDLEKVTILVVDDSIVNLEVAKGILERYKPTVLTAYSGAESLMVLKEEHVDCIFLDYMMPDMDGIATLKAIRALEDSKKSNTPVIVLTANAVSGAKEMFMAEGFNDYLSKPLELDKLEKVLLSNIPDNLIRFKV